MQRFIADLKNSDCNYFTYPFDYKDFNKKNKTDNEVLEIRNSHYHCIEIFKDSRNSSDDFQKEIYSEIEALKKYVLKKELEISRSSYDWFDVRLCSEEFASFAKSVSKKLNTLNCKNV